MTPDDKDAAQVPPRAHDGSIVDELFALTDDDRELALPDNDPLNGALQAVLARRMRAMLAADRENSKAA